MAHSVVDFVQSARAVDPLLPGWKGSNTFIKDSRSKGIFTMHRG